MLFSLRFTTLPLNISLTYKEGCLVVTKVQDEGLNKFICIGDWIKSINGVDAQDGNFKQVVSALCSGTVALPLSIEFERELAETTPFENFVASKKMVNSKMLMNYREMNQEWHDLSREERLSYQNSSINASEILYPVIWNASEKNYSFQKYPEREIIPPVMRSGLPAVMPNVLSLNRHTSRALHLIYNDLIKKVKTESGNNFKRTKYLINSIERMRVAQREALDPINNNQFKSNLESREARQHRRERYSGALQTSQCDTSFDDFIDFTNAKIRIGDGFQVDMDNIHLNVKKTIDTKRDHKNIWNPNRLDSAIVDQFLVDTKKYAKLDVALEKLAMEDYNVEKAKAAIISQFDKVIPNPAGIWNEEEKHIFEEKFFYCDRRTLRKVAAFISTKSTKQVISYYYGIFKQESRYKGFIKDWKHGAKNRVYKRRIFQRETNHEEATKKNFENEEKKEASKQKPIIFEPKPTTTPIILSSADVELCERMKVYWHAGKVKGLSQMAIVGELMRLAKEKGIRLHMTQQIMSDMIRFINVPSNEQTKKWLSNFLPKSVSNNQSVNLEEGISNENIIIMDNTEDDESVKSNLQKHRINDKKENNTNSKENNNNNNINEEERFDDNDDENIEEREEENDESVSHYDDDEEEEEAKVIVSSGMNNMSNSDSEKEEEEEEEDDDDDEGEINKGNKRISRDSKLDCDETFSSSSSKRSAQDNFAFVVNKRQKVV